MMVRRKKTCPVCGMGTPTRKVSQTNIRMDRECSVCYCDSGAFQTLVCGHSFCNGCIKSWYLKETGTGCPMCRRPIYFKGFHKVRDQWDEDALENKCAEVLSAALDTAFEDACEFAENFPSKIQRRIMRELINDFKDIEKTYRALRSYGAGPDDIEESFYFEDYYSDRHLNSCVWLDEPAKKWVTRYPQIEKGVGGTAKRGRAREDPWFTISIVIEI